MVKHKSKTVNARKLFNLVLGTAVFQMQCIWLENGPQIATKLIIEVKRAIFLPSHDCSECKQSNLSECMTDVTQCKRHLLQKSFYFISFCKGKKNLSLMTTFECLVLATHTV